MICTMFFFPLPCQIIVSWVDYVLKISNKQLLIWFSGWTEFHILQFLMIVMMEILLWIKCIILFFLLFFHHASGLLTDQLFNFCLKKKICFTSPFHHDFTGVYRCLRRRWFKLPQTCYSCVTINHITFHCTALDYFLQNNEK